MDREVAVMIDAEVRGPGPGRRGRGGAIGGEVGVGGAVGGEVGEDSLLGSN